MYGKFVFFLFCGVMGHVYVKLDIRVPVFTICEIVFCFVFFFFGEKKIIVVVCRACAALVLVRCATSSRLQHLARRFHISRLRRVLRGKIWGIGKAP